MSIEKAVRELEQTTTSERLARQQFEDAYEAWSRAAGARHTAELALARAHADAALSLRAA